MIDFMIHQRHIYLTEWKVLTKIGSTPLHPISRGDTRPSRQQLISVFTGLKAKHGTFQRVVCCFVNPMRMDVVFLDLQVFSSNSMTF